MKRIASTKIEILIDTPLVRKFRDIAMGKGAVGIMYLPVAGGVSGSGRWADDQVTGGAGSKVLFVTTIENKALDTFLSEIQPVLEEYNLEVTLVPAQTLGE